MGRTNREQDIQDLTSLIGKRNLMRCGACDRYILIKERERCPHCADQGSNSGAGRALLVLLPSRDEVAPPLPRPQKGPLQWDNGDRLYFNGHFAAAIEHIPDKGFRPVAWTKDLEYVQLEWMEERQDAEAAAEAKTLELWGAS